MRRALPLAAVLIGRLWLACSNDYEEGGPLVGDTGGKCFSDGSCKSGLLCLSDLCVVPPDAGTTSSSTSSSGGVNEAGATDGSPGGDSDAASAECAKDDTLGATPGVACESPLRCDVGSICCPRMTSVWECGNMLQGCASDTVRLDCDSPLDCPSDAQCCFVTDPAATHCADGILVSGTCAQACPPKSLAVCDPGHPCANGKCIDRTLTLLRSSRVLHRGLCAPAN